MEIDRQTLQQRCRDAAAGGTEGRRRFIEEHAPLIEVVLRRQFRGHDREMGADAADDSETHQATRRLTALARRICNQMIDRLGPPQRQADRETVARPVTRAVRV